ncbi:Mitochondrial 2-oxodicarboxylate carrier [Fukomys damarensis]|uniref:Mitochondrial 2-oxodicarboxylate carrier n=1 Tax=Fukomys damarensis TaxID=885580 RepID=A0A091DH29_FUKDA|nr:Mitochondrial 2-oxodicarboxylate carrier [Fukomys damarensis]
MLLSVVYKDWVLHSLQKRSWTDFSSRGSCSGRTGGKSKGIDSSCFPFASKACLRPRELPAKSVHLLSGSSGWLFGFYKGILPPILAETPKRAVKFFTFEQYKKLLGYVSLSPGLTFAIAGLGSGLTEAIVVNPSEVVKVGLQASRDTFTEQPSTLAYARQIIKKEGLGRRGLNKGLTATLGRHGVFNMVYFGFYFNVKSIVPVHKDPTLEFLRKFGIGLLSGTIASVINIPFDVAKSRIQGPQPVPGEIKYRTCFKTMATVYQEEGILALYKGLLPKIMRLGPGGAVMLLVYEYTYSWLKENW